MLSPQGQMFYGAGKPSVLLPIILILLLMFKEIKDEFYNKAPRFMHHPKMAVSAMWTAFMIILILLCGQFEGGQFIYFQF